jgi:hypothetical protein
MTDKEINPSPEGADLNLQRFKMLNRYRDLTFEELKWDILILQRFK